MIRTGLKRPCVIGVPLHDPQVSRRDLGHPVMILH